MPDMLSAAFSIAVLLVSGVLSVSLHFGGPGTASWTLEQAILPWIGSYEFLSGTGAKTVLLSVVDATTGSVLGQCSSTHKDKDWQAFSFAITSGSLHCNVSRSAPSRIRFPLSANTRSYLARFGSVDGADCVRDLVVSGEAPVECPPQLALNGFASEGLECGCPFDSSSETVASPVLELTAGGVDHHQPEDVSEQQSTTSIAPPSPSSSPPSPPSTTFPVSATVKQTKRPVQVGEKIAKPVQPVLALGAKTQTLNASLSSNENHPATPAELVDQQQQQLPIPSPTSRRQRPPPAPVSQPVDVPFPLFELSHSPTNAITTTATAAAAMIITTTNANSTTPSSTAPFQHSHRGIGSTGQQRTAINEHHETTTERSTTISSSATTTSRSTEAPVAPWTLPSHPCAMVVCENNGTCVIAKDGEAKCLCPRGYSGQFCEEDECSVYICMNGGRCQMTPDGKPKCICPSATTGPHCEQTRCSASCQNGGICTMIEGNGICQCPIGFVGANCNLRDPCMEVGRCSEFVSAKCQLDPMAPAIISPILVNASFTCLCQDENSLKWIECDPKPVFPPVRVVTSAPIAPPRSRSSSAPAIVIQTSPVPASIGRNPPGTPGTPVFPMHYFLSTVNGEGESNANTSTPIVTTLKTITVNATTTVPVSIVHPTNETIELTPGRQPPTDQPAPPIVSTFPMETEEFIITTTSSTPRPTTTRPASVHISEIPVETHLEPTVGITVEPSSIFSITTIVPDIWTSPETEEESPFQEFTEEKTHLTSIRPAHPPPSTVGSPTIEEIPVETSPGDDHGQSKHGHNIPVDEVDQNRIDDERLAGRRTAGPREGSSSSASWIAVVVLVLVLLILATVSTVLAFRYVKRSRKLHGKYNPAKEEATIQAGNSLPMTAVSKEERCERENETSRLKKMKLGLYAQKICHSIRRSVSERSEAQVEELMDQPLYDVFLGGSCGKTVWRRDYVIPYLKKRAISYYDPQRSEWSESLIEEESIAKENSKLFLFVLEPSTVNATSFLEIAYFAAKSSPRLVVVFLKRSEWSCRGHPKDMPDRHRTCSLLDAILTRHQVPCLQSIPEALDYIDEMILGNRSLAAILRDGRSLSPYLSIQGRRAMRQARSAFESFGNKAAHLVQGARSGRFPVVVCVLAVIALPVTQLATLALLHLFVQNIPLYVAVIALFVTTDMAVAGLALGLSAASAKRTQPNAMLSPSTPLAPLGSATVARNRLRTMMTPQESRSVISYDVFVSCSGTAPADLEWIDQSVVPQLNKHGLSYCSLATCGRERQLAVMRNSQHILYYIPSFRTFLSGMVEIAYLLGQSDWQVTICVPKEAEFMDGSPMEELNSKDLTVDDEKRSIERRNQCYSIAFCYLKDMAHRRKAQVFSRLSDAMAHVVTSAALNQRF